MRDVAQTGTVGIHAIDPLNDRSRHRVGFEAVNPLAEIRFGRVGVRTGVDQPVTVRWSTTKISRRVLRQCRHRSTDTHLDSRALPFAHAAEKSHHQVVCLRTGIDRAADLRHPQADSVMRKHRERERELRTVERAGRFPNHHRIELTVPRTDINKQA